MRGRDPRHARAHVLRLRAPLRARLLRRPGARQLARVRGEARRSARLATGRRLPRERVPHLPEGGAAPDRVRVLSRGRSARPAVLIEEGSGRAWARDRRPADDGPAHARRAARGLARRAADARRPGLRRRGVPGHALVHRDPARPIRGARRPGARLRGLHEALPRELERPGDPLAALHRLDDDDLRRPRRSRRLEHLSGLGRGGAQARVVERAHHGGAVVVLGLPAPRQSATRGP